MRIRYSCTPVDLVLMHCEITLSCLECGRDNTTSGINYGEHKDLWCKRCHAKLSVYVEQCRFIQHQPGAQMSLASAPPPKKSKKKSKKEALIQVGKPLPEMGTCQHYKKSNRWLRYVCMGVCMYGRMVYVWVYGCMLRCVYGCMN